MLGGYHSTSGCQMESYPVLSNCQTQRFNISVYQTLSPREVSLIVPPEVPYPSLPQHTVSYIAVSTALFT